VEIGTLRRFKERLYKFMKNKTLEDYTEMMSGSSWLSRKGLEAFFLFVLFVRHSLLVTAEEGMLGFGLIQYSYFYVSIRM